MNKDITYYLKKRKKLIDEALDKCLPKVNEYPPSIHKAMRYAVFSGGKRIRPILTLAAAECAGAKVKDAILPACALECIHAYSLVHDDLPYCDDDDFRRGKPSVHKKYNPTLALLSGDALLTLGFELLAKTGKRPGLGGELISIVSEAIGTYGMIGGQVIDLAMQNEEREPNLPTMQYIHTHKTGALITAALKIGGMCAGASKATLKKLAQYGEYVGIAFQVIDDIMDNEGYARAFGIRSAREKAARLISKAKKQLERFGKRAEPLRAIADYVLHREK
ncbi:MAG: polyprenyl synthetase family protein [Candidatus Omnitrophota bacterium]